MGCTHRELLQRMTARELAEWRVFFSLEPFGPAVDNINAAQICATLMNINRKKGSKCIQAMDIAIGKFKTPKRSDPNTATTPEDMKKLLMGLTKA